MAARLSEQSLADARRSGDRYVIVDLLQRLGENLLVLGRHDEADRLMDEAMELARTIPIGPLAATVIATRAAVDIELGRLSAAIGAGLEALRLTATLYPDPVVQASVLRILGAAWCSAGDLVLSARCDGAAAAVLQRAGAPIDRASLRPIDRRLEASRNDPGAASAARIAAMDPDAVIDELLGRSAASSLRS
jgi:tetratricopeptide (TPR) repeat protein